MGGTRTKRCTPYSTEGNCSYLIRQLTTKYLNVYLNVVCSLLNAESRIFVPLPCLVGRRRYKGGASSSRSNFQARRRGPGSLTFRYLALSAQKETTTTVLVNNAGILLIFSFPCACSVLLEDALGLQDAGPVVLDQSQQLSVIDFSFPYGCTYLALLALACLVSFLPDPAGQFSVWRRPLEAPVRFFSFPNPVLVARAFGCSMNCDTQPAG